MKVNIQRPEERTVSEFNDVSVRHCFNFGSFFNPLREKFGVLRVLNDEQLTPGFCFNQRFHKHIEVLLLPLGGKVSCSVSEGEITTADSENTMLISTATGLSYTICNPDTDQSAEVIEVWLFAIKGESQPAVTTCQTAKTDRYNNLQLIASGNSSDDCLTLKQHAFVWRIDLSADRSINYRMKIDGNILFIFVIKGAVTLDNDNTLQLNDRDSAELTEVSSGIVLKAINDSELLIIEVPID
jgi:quercetin 2,3-dioxygenase